jgi:DNA-binding IclR family transcriptional regulator
MAVSAGELESGTNAVAMPVFSDHKAIAALELQVRDPRAELARLTAALVMACGSLARELNGGLPPELSVGRFVQAVPYTAPVTKVVAGQ